LLNFLSALTKTTHHYPSDSLNTVLNIQVPSNAVNSLTAWVTVDFSRITLLLGVSSDFSSLWPSKLDPEFVFILYELLLLCTFLIYLISFLPPFAYCLSYVTYISVNTEHSVLYKCAFVLSMFFCLLVC